MWNWHYVKPGQWLSVQCVNKLVSNLQTGTHVSLCPSKSEEKDHIIFPWLRMLCYIPGYRWHWAGYRVSPTRTWQSNALLTGAGIIFTLLDRGTTMGRLLYIVGDQITVKLQPYGSLRNNTVNEITFTIYHSFRKHDKIRGGPIFKRKNVGV